MASTGDLLLYGAAGLAGAEALGVTDFVGGDDGGTLGDGQLPPGIAALLAARGGRGGGGVPASVLEALTTSAGNVPTGTGADAGTIAAEVGDAISSTVEATTSTVPTAGPTTVPTGTTGTTGTTGGQTDGVNTSRSDEFDLQDLAGTSRLGTGLAVAGEAGKATGSTFDAAGKFVSDNPIATAGAGLGLLAAPFTGGASVPAGIALAGGVGEVGADLATGQYGNPLKGGLGPVDSAISGTQEAYDDVAQAGIDAGDDVAGGLDHAAGSTDEAVGRTVDEVSEGDAGGAFHDVTGGVFRGVTKGLGSGGDGGSSSTSSSSTSNQTETKDERGEAAKARDLDLFGASYGSTSSSSSSSTDVPTSSSSSNDSGGGWVNSDDDGAVWDGPDPLGLGGGSSSSSNGGSSGTDEDAEKDKKEDNSSGGGAWYSGPDPLGLGGS